MGRNSAHSADLRTSASVDESQPALSYLLEPEEIYDVLVRGDNLTTTVHNLIERVGPTEHIVACAVVDVPPYLPRHDLSRE